MFSVGGGRGVRVAKQPHDVSILTESNILRVVYVRSSE
jgi:hypothetical protein